MPILALLSGVSLRTWFIIGGVVLLIGGGIFFRAHYINVGKNTVIEKINKDVKDARDQKDKDREDIDRGTDDDLDNELRERRGSD